MIKNDEEGIACRYYYLKIVATFHNFVVIKNAILGQALVGGYFIVQKAFVKNKFQDHKKSKIDLQIILLH